MKRIFAVFVLVQVLVSLSANAQVTSRQQELRSRTEAVMDALDSATVISNEDFIVSMFQQILSANPSELEAFTAQLLLEGVGTEEPMLRSHFVEQLLVLKGGKDYISWKDIEQNIDLLEGIDASAIPAVGVYNTRVQEDLSAKEKKYLKPVRHLGGYKPYYGYLHAHSELSDGRGDAISAYHMARYTAKLDYFALTDHSELLHFWPWNKEYKKLRDIANRFNQKGKFAALYGFEWSHPILGHFNIVNTNRYTTAILRPTMGLLMNWLGRRKGAFGRFNHPGRVNQNFWPWEFRKLKVYNQALHNTVGIEMWNKSDNLRDYLYNRGSFKKNTNFLDNANQNGWFVGAVGGQDNHDVDWGLRNDYRVGAWAKDLSRKEIVKAYFARRTFATEDKNASVSFRMSDAEMGSRLRAGKHKVRLRFRDKNGEKVVRAQIIKKGKVHQTFRVSRNQKVFTNLEGRIGDYFYVIAEQGDGDILLSSPIWIVP